MTAPADPREALAPAIVAAVHAFKEAENEDHGEYGRGCVHFDKGYGPYAACEDPDNTVPLRALPAILAARQDEPSPALRPGLDAAIDAIEAIPAYKPKLSNGRAPRDAHSTGFVAGVQTGKEVAVLAIRALRAANPPQTREARYCATCGIEEAQHWHSPPGYAEHDFRDAQAEGAACHWPHPTIPGVVMRSSACEHGEGAAKFPVSGEQHGGDPHTAVPLVGNSTENDETVPRRTPEAQRDAPAPEYQPAGPCGIVGCGVLRDYHDDLDHEWSASFVPGDTGGAEDDEAGGQRDAGNRGPQEDERGFQLAHGLAVDVLAVLDVERLKGDDWLAGLREHAENVERFFFDRAATQPPAAGTEGGE